MAQVTVTPLPRIHKHVDACSFSFRNDTGKDIVTGQTVEVGNGKLCGIANVCIGNDECGSVQLLCGPIVGHRIYLEEPLSAPICVGDKVFHPVTGKYLGVAIHGGFRGVARGLTEPVADVGDTCIWFLGLKEDSGSGGSGGEGGDMGGDGGGGNPSTAAATACATYAGAESIPESGFPVVSPSGTSIRGSMVKLTPVEGSAISIDDILAGQDKSTLPDGYTVKFHNIGLGTITMTAEGTGNVISFNQDEYVCLECCNGDWVWS